jgi:sec-independent protein translocase protein TatA
MPFGIGPAELIIVLVIILIIFGVGRLPEIGGALGKGIREFRKTSIDAKDTIKDIEKSLEGESKTNNEHNKT